MIEAILVNQEPDFEKRICYDCKHCKAAVSWWCTREDAIQSRKTKIPDAIKCKFWEPCKMKKDLKWSDRLFNSYIEIRETNA